MVVPSNLLALLWQGTWTHADLHYDPEAAHPHEPCLELANSPRARSASLTAARNTLYAAAWSPCRRHSRTTASSRRCLGRPPKAMNLQQPGGEGSDEGRAATRW